VAGVTVYHVGLGSERVYIHTDVDEGPAAGVWEVRYEPRSAHSAQGAREPGKWVTMLPDGSVHFAEAEEATASTLRPALERLLGPEVAGEVFGQLPPEW
jgi:hypothetical protein